MTVFYFDSHFSSAEEYSSIALSFAIALFTSLTFNAAKSFIPFGRIKRHPKAWWCAEIKKWLVKDVRLSLPLREVMKIVRLTSPLPDVSSVIVESKTEVWQVTCSSLSPKSKSKSAHSLFRSVAGSSSSSPNFPNCSSPR